MKPVALLAPVPERHLLSGRRVCEEKGLVVFGSRDWELFRTLDALLAPEGRCEVLIFASHAAHPISPPRATWRGTYCGHSESVNGAHRRGMEFRPPTTAAYPADNRGHWAVFWELDSLEPLAANDQLPIGALWSLKPRKLLKSFIPHGPMLIEAL